MNLTHNGTPTKIAASIAWNNKGCEAHVNDTDESEIYSLLRADETPTFESEDGYTYNRTMEQNGKRIINAEFEVDFYKEGANIGVPSELADWKYGVVTGLEGSQLFFQVNKDDNDNVVSTEKHLIYENAIDGSCLNKTQSYCNLIPAYLWSDSSGELIKDSSGEYILLADWYTQLNN